MEEASKRSIPLQEEMLNVMKNDKKLWEDIKTAEEEDAWNNHPTGDGMESVLFNYALRNLKEYAKDEKTYKEQYHRLMFYKQYAKGKVYSGQAEGSEAADPEISTVDED